MFLHGGASGAIAAVLGACFVLYPESRVRTWIFPVFLVRIPAWIFLGLWFLYQLIEASFGLFSASANGGGVVGPRDPLAATGEAGRPWRRCASAPDRVQSVLS
jgi:membrane associated rhomboid family serine protease